MLEEVVVALSSSVNDLGLYGCHFSRYEEMVSFVRAFPHCNTLYIKDCVTGGQDSPMNAFAGLPQHKLSIVDLDLTASSTSDLLIDPSGFIEDAELDVSPLRKLACDLESVEGSRRIVSVTSESPVRELRFSATCTDGFQGIYIFHFSTPSSRLTIVITAFITSVSPRWCLESLTIGPMYHEAATTFWDAALKNFPALPHLTKVQIIYHYRTYKAFNTSCWDRFDPILSNRNMFPRLKAVDVCPTFRAQRPSHQKLFYINDALRFLSSFGPKLTLTYWG
jgi:hypothetical protein